MSMMALFREIHRLLTFAHELEESLARIPRQRKAQQARVTRAEQAVKDENEAIKRLRVTASEKDKTLKDFGDKLTRYQDQMSASGNVKEYDALRVQISHASDQSVKLSDEILSAMTEADERAGKVLDMETALVTTREEVATFEKGVAPREADWQTQLVKAKADLAASETCIPVDHKSVYQRTRSLKGHETLAEVKGRNCTACNTEISLTSRSGLQADGFQTCKSCGRILFLVEAPPRESDADEA